MDPLRRRPTGVASDDLTVFYWDETDMTEKAGWRLSSSTALEHIETLGGLRGATPNAACDNLYYSAAGDAGGLDLFVATRR
jgi:hypothetical protein